MDCYNAGATVLHVHVRDPKTGHISKNFKEYSDLIGGLRQAVPQMILQIGGSISFAPEPGQQAHWQGYDTRHTPAEINPKPDQVTVGGARDLRGPLHRLCLRAFGALGHLKLDLIALIEGLEAGRLNGRVVNKHIRATIGLRDEPKPFLVIEPFHRATRHD